MDVGEPGEREVLEELAPEATGSDDQDLIGGAGDGFQGGRTAGGGVVASVDTLHPDPQHGGAIGGAAVD